MLVRLRIYIFLSIVSEMLRTALFSIALAAIKVG